MSDTTKTHNCKQCCEQVNPAAAVCPHCQFEQRPAACKTCRKRMKRAVKKFIAFFAVPSAIIIIAGTAFYDLLNEGVSESWLRFVKHLFWTLVCVHFFAFHIVYDEDEKKGGDDGGGGGGGGE